MNLQILSYMACFYVHENWNNYVPRTNWSRDIKNISRGHKEYQSGIYLIQTNKTEKGLVGHESSSHLLRTRISSSCTSQELIKMNWEERKRRTKSFTFQERFSPPLTALGCRMKQKVYKEWNIWSLVHIS